MKNDFEKFEKQYSKLFKQLKWRIDKYEDILKEHENVDDAYNYVDVINDNVFILSWLVNDQIRFMKEVDIDKNLFNMNDYIRYLNNLIDDLKKFNDKK